MKNQTEWIIRGVFIVVAIGVIAYSIFGAREPIQPPVPEKAVLTEVQLPAGSVSYSLAAGGGTGGAAAPGGAAPGRPGGGGAGPDGTMTRPAKGAR